MSGRKKVSGGFCNKIPVSFCRPGFLKDDLSIDSSVSNIASLSELQN